MKLGRVNDSRFHMALTKLASMPIPLRAAFKLKGIAHRVGEETKKFEEVRQGALQTFGSKDEKGELLVDEQGATDIEVGTLSIAELGDKLTLPTEDVIALDGILVE
jgi:hypothetical protein